MVAGRGGGFGGLIEGREPGWAIGGEDRERQKFDGQRGTGGEAETPRIQGVDDTEKSRKREKEGQRVAGTVGQNTKTNLIREKIEFRHTYLYI